jgi:signal transduction histidine kinase
MEDLQKFLDSVIRRSTGLE